MGRKYQIADVQVGWDVFSVRWFVDNWREPCKVGFLESADSSWCGHNKRSPTYLENICGEFSRKRHKAITNHFMIIEYFSQMDLSELTCSLNGLLFATM